jgi:sugar lactone lactonase YvrE
MALGAIGVSACGGDDNSVPTFYTIGGSVSGLSGSGLVLTDNDNDPLTVSKSGSFVFSLGVPYDDGYSVAVFSQPIQPAQTCTVTSGSGIVGTADVTNISVTCKTNPGNVDGVGALGAAASFGKLTGVVVDAAGHPYVADESGGIRKVTETGAVTTLVDKSAVSGESDARAVSISQIAIDGSGNLYVADTTDNAIRKVTPAGAVTTLAGTSGVLGSADGIGAAAQFAGPEGVATDAAGNVYVADTGNNAIRKIAPSGAVTTLAGGLSYGAADGVGSAAQFNRPAGLASDTAGNLYVADSGNSTIRKITPNGAVTTIAGQAGTIGVADGSGHEARFSQPRGVAVDTLGDIYIADTGNDTIRKMTRGGKVTTLAGEAKVAGSVDGTGGVARFDGPRAVALDAGGDVYVADTQNTTLRKIIASGAVCTLAGVAAERETGNVP